MTRALAEPITAIVLLLAAGLGWMHTLSIPGPAALFPRIALSMLGLLSILYLVRSLFMHREDIVLFFQFRRFSAALVLIFLYISAFTYVGYFTATLVFIAAFAYAVGFRRKYFIVLSASAFTVLIYVLFSLVFERRLPAEALLTYWG